MHTFRLFLCLTMLTGGIYPLVITAVAQLFFSYQANGSFIEFQDKKIGSVLIAQKFENVKYFWPRPSAIDFNPLPSGGSHLGPINVVLKKAVEKRRLMFISQGHPDKVPSDLLYASGSGVDPHITPEAAYFQAARVAQARQLNEAELRKLIADHTEGATLGFIGEPRVNVLELNLALDRKAPARANAAQ